MTENETTHALTAESLTQQPPSVLPSPELGFTTIGKLQKEKNGHILKFISMVLLLTQLLSYSAENRV